jgi:hypothetical protein
MLFYVRCPTCSRQISENLGKFYNEKEEIENDNNLSGDEKEKKVSKLLKKSFPDAYICCISRILTTPPYWKIIES